jgi:hypothetical protein
MNEAIKKNGIKFGVITGAISVVLTLTFYLIDIKLFINIWLGFGLIFLYLAIGIYQLIELKKDLSGKMPFKEAFTGYFYAAFIGISISTLFSILLFRNESFRWNLLAGFICLVMAVYFIFKK